MPAFLLLNSIMSQVKLIVQFLASREKRIEDPAQVMLGNKSVANAKGQIPAERIFSFQRKRGFCFYDNYSADPNKPKLCPSFSGEAFFLNTEYTSIAH